MPVENSNSSVPIIDENNLALLALIDSAYANGMRAGMNMAESGRLDEGRRAADRMAAEALRVLRSQRND